MTELATKTTTADSRIGSHSALRPVIETSGAGREAETAGGPPRFYHSRTLPQCAAEQRIAATVARYSFGFLTSALASLPAAVRSLCAWLACFFTLCFAFALTVLLLWLTALAAFPTSPPT